MSTVRAVYKYLLRHWRLLLFGGFLVVVANLIVLIPPLLLQQAIDTLGSGDDIVTLTKLAFLIVGVWVVGAAFQFSARFSINSVSRQVEYEMRGDLFKHFQRLDLAYFQHRKLGDLVARATNDLTAVRQMLGPGISNLCNTLVAFTLTAIAMLGIDVRLTLYTLTIMPLMSVLFFLVGRSIHTRYRKVQDQFGEVSARAQENFSGIRVVKAYAQEQYELDAFNQVNEEYVSRSLAFARVNSLLWPSMYFLSGLAVAILLWRGGLDVIDGRITLGELVRFNTYLAALAWPMIALGWTVNLFQQGSASISRIQEVMVVEPAIQDSERTREGLTLTHGDVEFRHVSLTYGYGYGYGESEVLHDININVPAGTSLAIVGATGSGKSSIVNLLARVFDVTSGAVLIDGVDVRDIPVETLRRTLGYVPQDNFLFSLTLEENVGFGVEALDAERLAYVLQVAQLEKDLVDFPHGASTMLGERGVTLSGGQKQRTGIARAVAKDPLVLILDDALSSVDTNTEAAILRGLKQVMEGRTSIVISHRISTVQDLDQIVVIDDGRVVERGTHDQLLTRRGIYASMYRRQLLGQELDESDELGEADEALIEDATRDSSLSRAKPTTRE